MDYSDENETIIANVHWVCLIPHILLIFLMVGFITIWKPLIAMFTTKLEINDKRVVGKMGLIKILTMDTPINKISSVKIEQGLMGQIFSYGTICIGTSSGYINFDYIKNPTYIRNVINEKIEVSEN